MTNSEKRSYKRDGLFLTLSGVFLTALIMGNIVGTTKFVTIFSFHIPEFLLPLIPELARDSHTYTMTIPAGLLAFPVTFLATDMLCELFGRKKAQMVIWVGLAMNIFMIGVLTAGYYMPDTDGVSGGREIYDGMYSFMMATTMGSMIAYVIAQTIDVQLFHFWKGFTNGKHLWLRNNGSTMISQLIDSTAITTFLYLAGNLGEEVTGIGALIIVIINAYVFKFFAALFDTPLCYFMAWLFKNYHEDPENESFYKKQDLVTN